MQKAPYDNFKNASLCSAFICSVQEVYSVHAPNEHFIRFISMPYILSNPFILIAARKAMYNTL